MPVTLHPEVVVASKPAQTGVLQTAATTSAFPVVMVIMRCRERIAARFRCMRA